MERGAHQQQVVVRQRLCLTIATPALRIGWQGGVWPRRRGAAVTGARVAHRQQVVAPEHHGFDQVAQEVNGAGVSAIFRRYSGLAAFGTIGTVYVFSSWEK